MQCMQAKRRCRLIDVADMLFTKKMPRVVVIMDDNDGGGR